MFDSYRHCSALGSHSFCLYKFLCTYLIKAAIAFVLFYTGSCACVCPVLPSSCGAHGSNRWEERHKETDSGRSNCCKGVCVSGVGGGDGVCVSGVGGGDGVCVLGVGGGDGVCVGGRW